MTKLKCAECGNTETIETQMWVNPNTHEIGGDVAEGDKSSNYCGNCGNDVRFEVVDEREPETTKPDLFHFQEVMQLSYSIGDLLERHLENHPVMLEHDDIQTLIHCAVKDLAQIYQLASLYQLQAETKDEIDKLMKRNLELQKELKKEE